MLIYVNLCTGEGHSEPSPFPCVDEFVTSVVRCRHGVREDGVREDGVRTGREDGVREDGVRQDGVREDGVRTGREDGRIWRWAHFSQGSGTLVYDIVRNRWCGNIGREHRSNNIRLL